MTASLLASAIGQVNADHIPQEIDQLIQTSNYINSQVSAALDQVGYNVDNAATGYITTPGTYYETQIDQTAVQAYNQALEDILGASYYSASDFYEDQYEDTMDQLGAAVDVFTEAAVEISVVEAVFDEAISAEGVEAQVDLQNYIRANDVVLEEATVATFNQSLESIEEYSQEAAVLLNASVDINVLSATDSHAVDTLSNLTRTDIQFDAWKDNLVVAYDTGFETHIQDYFIANQMMMEAGESIEGFLGDGGSFQLYFTEEHAQ